MSLPGEKCNKIVVARRDKVYTGWFRNEETNKWEEREVGRGWEIVKEINAVDSGVELWNSWPESERALFVKRLSSGG